MIGQIHYFPKHNFLFFTKFYTLISQWFIVRDCERKNYIFKSRHLKFLPEILYTFLYSLFQMIKMNTDLKQQCRSYPFRIFQILYISHTFQIHIIFFY